VRPKLAGAVVIGAEQTPFLAALSRHAPGLPVVPIRPGQDGTVMPQAVAAARALARPGQTVLLAPAAASMDQFDSYAARGQAFAAAARALGAGGEG
jgi:UDP-N-acetylmuramoylalanine--D-glutamate ligase